MYFFFNVYLVILILESNYFRYFYVQKLELYYCFNFFIEGKEERIKIGGKEGRRQRGRREEEWKRVFFI